MPLSHHDIKDTVRTKIIVEMIKMRDRHIEEIRRLLDCDLYSAVQVEAQLRYGLPPK